MCWTHQIASCHQPCHGGITAWITGFPNMVCMVNHAMEDLQHRILDISKYCSLHYNMKMKRTKEREEKNRQQREQYTEREERKKQNNGILGWQDRVLHM